MIRSIRLALACAAILAVTPAAALGQPTGDKKKALALYEKGNTQYNLGRWKEAIALFTQAYEVYTAPEFLFNIAQAHRQDDNCPDALFFYQRYLANKPNATNRAEVEKFIRELEAKCSSATGTTGTGTTGTGTTGTGTTGTGKTGTGTSGTGTSGTGTSGTGTSGTGTSGTGTSGKTGSGTSGTGTSGTAGTGRTGTGTTGTGTSGSGIAGTGKTGTGSGTRTADTTTTVTEVDEEIEDDEDGRIDTEEPTGPPRLFTSSAAVGPSFLFAGELDTPVLMAFSIGGGYPLHFDKLTFEPGGLITYNPVPWEGMATDVTGTSSLIGLLANAAGGYPVIPTLPAFRARAELGFGLLIMNGLDRGSPFLDENQFADGAIAMFHARLALGAEYMVTPNIAVFAHPVVVSFSPASKLRDEISTLTRYEILFGAGYKM